jgi:hypothetical protein
MAQSDRPINRLAGIARVSLRCIAAYRVVGGKILFATYEMQMNTDEGSLSAFICVHLPSSVATFFVF